MAILMISNFLTKQEEPTLNARVGLNIPMKTSGGDRHIRGFCGINPYGFPFANYLRMISIGICSPNDLFFDYSGCNTLKTCPTGRYEVNRW